jgi:hypothetical protein
MLRSAAKLAKIGVQTSADLTALDPDNARTLMMLTGGRKVYELLVYQRFQGVLFSFHAEAAVMLEHVTGDVACDVHIVCSPAPLSARFLTSV